MSKTKDEKMAKQSRDKLDILKKLLGVKNNAQLSLELGIWQETISRVANGYAPITDRIFLRAAILLDMKPSELMEKLDISQEYFFEFYNRNRRYE